MYVITGASGTWVAAVVVMLKTPGLLAPATSLLTTLTAYAVAAVTGPSVTMVTAEATVVVRFVPVPSALATVTMDEEIAFATLASGVQLICRVVPTCTAVTSGAAGIAGSD